MDNDLVLCDFFLCKNTLAPVCGCFVPYMRMGISACAWMRMCGWILWLRACLSSFCPFEHETCLSLCTECPQTHQAVLCEPNKALFSRATHLHPFGGMVTNSSSHACGWFWWFTPCSLSLVRVLTSSPATVSVPCKQCGGCGGANRHRKAFNSENGVLFPSCGHHWLRHGELRTLAVIAGKSFGGVQYRVDEGQHIGGAGQTR